MPGSLSILPGLSGMADFIPLSPTTRSKSMSRTPSLRPASGLAVLVRKWAAVLSCLSVAAALPVLAGCGGPASSSPTKAPARHEARETASGLPPQVVELPEAPHNTETYDRIVE